MTEDLPLILNEKQVARLVLGPGRDDEWKGLVQVLEAREGFPPINLMFGGRYREAIIEWFRVKHGLSSIATRQFRRSQQEELCPEPRKRRGSDGDRGATVHRLPTGSPTKNT